MPVSLTLKRRGAYTNLDYVEGDVHLDISSAEHIESVVVKIEGRGQCSAVDSRHQQDDCVRKEARERPIKTKTRRRSSQGTPQIMLILVTLPATDSMARCQTPGN
jgi:hypothetical protein